MMASALDALRKKKMLTKVKRPNATKVLARKLKELRREQRDLEGIERRGFVHDSDEKTTQRRLKEIRRDIATIEDVLDGED